MHGVNNINGKIFGQQNALTPTLSMADALLGNGEHKKAVAVYLQLEKADDTTFEVKRAAQLKIGQILEAGIGDGIEQDYAKALDYYVEAANNGLGQALEEIETIQIDPDYFSKEGVLFEDHVEQLLKSFQSVAHMYSMMGNVSKYNKWMNKASALSRVQNQIDEVSFRIKNQLDATDLIEELWKESEQCRISSQIEAEYSIYLFLAGLGYARAEYNLGAMYFHGKNVVKDVEKGVVWFKSSAEHGNINAQYDLGRYYLDGIGVARNVEEALKYFKMAAENKKADGSANYQLGLIYIKGEDDVAPNFAKALGHFIRAAELGDADAQLILGRIYISGYGVAKDLEKALTYFNLAAENDNANGFADIQLGYMYLNGAGVEKNVTKALEYYTRGAALGNVHAQFALGCIYFYGDDVDRNDEKALTYFKLAAKNKNADGSAAKRLGLMYRRGDGVARDFTKALKYFNKGAALGNARAQYELGCIYFSGVDVARDVKKALTYFEMAVNNKNPDGFADTKLGLMYMSGDGVPKDDVKAVHHLTRGAKKGNGNASNKLKELLSVKMMSECSAMS